MTDKIECLRCGHECESEHTLVDHYQAEHGEDPQQVQEHHPLVDQQDVDEYQSEGEYQSNINIDASVDLDEVSDDFETVDEASEESKGPDVTVDSVPTESVSSDEGAASPVEQSDDPGESSETSDDPTSFFEEETEPDDSSEQTVPSADNSDNFSVGGRLDTVETDRDYKWFLFGVGGCGGNLVDAVILRSETLKDGREGLHDAWPDAVRGIATVNTNTADELLGTYYAQEYRDRSARNVAEDHGLGPDGVQGAGAVEQIGAEAAEWTFNRDELDFAGNYLGRAADIDRINDAQAVIFLHSAVKGTGTGATPVIASELDAALGSSGENGFSMLNTGLTKFSVSVLPDQTADVQEKCNGIVGFSRLAQQIDAIIPIDNKSLEDPPDNLRVSIDGGEQYQFHNHRDRNRMLMSFLETFTLSGVRMGGDTDGMMRGDGFDLEDAYNPARNLRAGDGSDMAVVMAPAYGILRTGGRKFDRDGLSNLVTNTLTEGKLVDFDHTTGWGGAFLVEAPQEQDDHVRSVFDRHFDEIIERPEHLNTREDVTDSPQMFPTRQQYAFRTDIDSIRLWALVYNPEIPRISQWRDWAEKHREGQQNYQKRLDDKWDEIESLFDVLGRENLV